jgi:hypothetical protein
MPDISMCSNPSCPKTETCYRHQASGTQPNPWRQAYAGFTWDKEKKCEYYWPIQSDGKQE